MTQTIHEVKVGAALVEAQEAVDGYNEVLGHPSVDEIALMVPHRKALDGLSYYLGDFGWTPFNHAVDAVRTDPIISSYEVEYHFFSHPDRDYRLEIMLLLSGYSPLHGALRKPAPGELCVPVHASFKCGDEEMYAYARAMLTEKGLYESQRCVSTYGRFSYWTDLKAAREGVSYLKPRVNLRDAD